ncbi:MAG: DUF1571 domain-containing protein [Planctomycetaceae bacterium]
MPRSNPSIPSLGRNTFAASIALFSVGILYSSFDPVPAGDDISVQADVPTSYSAYASYDETSVPLPAGVKITPGEGVEAVATTAAEADDTTADTAETAPGAQTASGNAGNVLSNMETIKFCVLLLQDGARYMNGLKDYTAHFHKEERIDGDLQAPQTIALKVQHKPHFAVYMNWQNGERGRQVLFSEDYEDGNMVVKLGGMKRFLPAVKVDPHCSLAKAESRYPITQAGVLGMINQIVEHRQRDLKRGHGVSCVRLPNVVFDEKDCYRFVLTYEDRQFSDVYRKSIMMIDAELHIPLMITNFTWATDAENLSEEELDKATLIENYSFTRLNTKTELAAQDFSRDNPSYRM